ncbi:MAG: hypothetical protein A3G38_01420 [Omnitrophica WOR_2 bacterium RIFCSPLOWO2_12_FULL_51_8]|nr:MAG: hypothetical protein A3G38_01420 [Omnitrophica WOR_2 bacterium RIFCSPLOWO2_12_FULL_51_8]
MNILFLTTHLNTGGITSYVLALAKGLKAKGHQVYIVSSGGEALPRFQVAGINHLAIPIKTKCEFSPRVILSFFRLAREVQEKGIDIIHANTRVTQVLSWLLSRFTGKPYVSTCHGFFRARLSRRIFPCWGSKVVAVSAQVKDHLVKDFRLNEADIRLIYHGIEVENFKSQVTSHPSTEFIPSVVEGLRTGKSQVREKFGLGEGPVVGIVARLSAVKGHIYLIEAMQEVLKKIPAAQLMIVGTGRIQPELAGLAKRLGVEKNIFFIPAVADTAEALSVMDVFVMPSLQEGLGLGLMEAMASGAAVVGSDIGGIKALIQDGSTGRLVRPRDAAGLAQAITDLLNDARKRQSLGNNAREFIRRNFGFQAMVDETERLYAECLKRKK